MTGRNSLCGVALLGIVLFLVAPVQAARALVISPLNGTPDASPLTQISFLGTSPGEISQISVVGSRSGRHPGRLEPYSSAPGASFVPTRRFTEGESVRVSALVGPAGRARRVTSDFSVARLGGFVTFAPGPSKGAPRAQSGSVQSYVSEPEMHPPNLYVTLDSPQASPGDLFLTPGHGPGQYGPMILDGAGRLVWFQRVPPGDIAADLQVEHYEGRPVLVWWQGRIFSPGLGLGEDEIYNSSYQPVASIGGGNGYAADLHDVRLTPQGSAFITAYSAVHADLSSAGGSRRGTLIDSILQEVDVKTGLVMFEWHSWGHVPLSDSFTRPSAGQPWDYFHINSVSLDPWGDGNFIVSSRNTWAAYEISQHTGAILWSIGGRHPSFKMGPGTGVAWQHDVRWQPDQTLTIFDDGASPRRHSQSRAIRERIDWRNRSVTLVGRDVHRPALLAGSQGDDQVLLDGNSLVGWGEEPFLSEFSPTGQVLFDARLPASEESYRAFRFAWNGAPAGPPEVAIRPAGPGALTVYASWNGATGVSAWRILGGASPDALTPITTAARSGFETTVEVHSSDSWFAAQALGPAGNVLAGSPPAQP